MDLTTNLLDFLKINVVVATKNNACVHLTITDNIRQPYGIVHGGINATLAETAASLAGQKNCPKKMHPVGLSITTNHLAASSTGQLIATATPQKIGRTISVWDVKIINATADKTRLVATSCVTLMNVAD